MGVLHPSITKSKDHKNGNNKRAGPVHLLGAWPKAVPSPKKTLVPEEDACKRKRSETTEHGEMKVI